MPLLAGEVSCHGWWDVAPLSADPVRELLESSGLDGVQDRREEPDDAVSLRRAPDLPAKGAAVSRHTVTARWSQGTRYPPICAVGRLFSVIEKIGRNG